MNFSFVSMYQIIINPYYIPIGSVRARSCMFSMLLHMSKIIL